MKLAHLVAFAGAAAFAAAASAQTTVLSWSFSDLSGSYQGSSAGGSFGAVWNNTAGTGSSGDVTRLAAPSGTALFGVGSGANVNFSLAVSGINLVTGIASGNGTFSITGGNGTVLSGLLNGTFTRLGSGPGAGLAFSGTVSGVSFSNNTTLTGTSGGSFSSDFSAFGTLTGFGVILTIPNNAGNFFGSSFGPVSTQSSGQVIPSPGSIALLGLGGLVAARRRRV